MDAATLQQRIYKGYRLAAQRIGYPFTLYRPQSVNNPIIQTNIVGAPLNASFTTGQGFNYNKWGKHEDVLWSVLVDGTQTKVGDYLVSTARNQTYFIAAQQDELPILSVLCSHVLSVSRAAAPAVLGTNTYSGATLAGQTPVMTSWPGSLVMQRHAAYPDAQLPMDVSAPAFVILLPHFSGADIRTSDIITDDNNPNRRYTVAGTELTSLGWRIAARIAVS
jgi:hypothetical protein